jgi:neurocalcin delta
MGNKPNKSGSSTELTPKHIALLKANTKYTEKEIRDWHAGFIRDCPTGKLDKKKFAEVYKQFYPNGKADNFCKYAFQTFDANHDGTIDFEEFLIAISATSQGDLDDRLSVAFDMYDISNDGKIDQKELTALLSAMYDLVGETNRTGDRDPKKRAAEIIAKLDVGGDRKLNKQEFIAGCKNDPHIRQLLAPNV